MKLICLDAEAEGLVTEEKRREGVRGRKEEKGEDGRNRMNRRENGNIGGKIEEWGRGERVRTEGGETERRD